MYTDSLDVKVCVGLLGGTEVWNNWQAYAHFTPPPNDARTHPFKLLLETEIFHADISFLYV